MIEPYNSKILYWTCLKHHEHVFTTKHGVIPFCCPFCDTRHVRSCSKSWYETMRDNQRLAFENYKHRTGDISRGCYGRFMWKYVFGGDKKDAAKS